MIEQLRRAAPFIHFGFGVVEIPDIDADSIIDVWQDTIYNNAFYTVSVYAPDAVVLSAELGRIRLQFPTSGVTTIKIIIENTAGTLNLESNMLPLGVK